MNITWFEREELTAAVIKQLREADVVLDIGCGIMPQPYITPGVHICCEPFEQYIEVLREKLQGELDRTYVFLNATWTDAVRIFPADSVDTVFLVDVIEHLEKEDGLRLIHATEKIARNQIVLFTPLGFMPQVHEDHKDAWNLDGGSWQEHKSGWVPEDFNDNWQVLACKDFHKTDNMGNPLQEPFGAFWAIWNAPGKREDEGQRFQKAPESLWLHFQSLQHQYQSLAQEHQSLQHEYQSLAQEYQSLQHEYQSFAQEHQRLQQEHQRLQQEHQRLQQEHECLQRDHQTLLQGHQLLLQKKAVIFQNELRKFPLLMKLASAVYSLSSRIHSVFKKG